MADAGLDGSSGWAYHSKAAKRRATGQNDMRGTRWTTAVWVAAGLALAGAIAFRSGPTRGELEADNPISAVAPPPFGMEEFFAAAPVQPAPARVRLGRWLFYDTRLSRDGSVACATCHRPDHAFSEPTRVSTGIDGRLGRRKAMPLLNLAARTTLVDTPDGERHFAFFWDGRVPTLEAQALVPIAHPDEMDLHLPALVARLSAIPGYRVYFQDAFGTGEVTTDRVAAALADYVRTRMSGNAPYDRWRYTPDRAAMSAAAKRGSDLFFFTARCAMCHAGFNFSDGRFHNLGVGWDPTARRFSDEGRALVTGVERDRGAFRTPGLRDVSKHPPYMHDGSLASLREVVEFYNRGGIANPWRSRRLGALGLTAREVEDLVAFLQALDGEGYQDRAPRFFPR